ncbi:MAG: ATP-grasp domain-containing protein [Candidatus Bathyarchaeota archaeon]|nr:ATP-grasp domain-containing protein [Candidatus Bathyarchaeota archaeon]
MRILIYEYFSGGGLTNNSLASSMLCEGLGMLKTLISDFKAAGHFIITILDSRIINSNFSLINADKIILISPLEKLQNVISENSRYFDAAYVIAPESNGTLQTILKIIQNSGITSLNCSINGINKVSNKIILYNFFKKNEVKSPKSINFNLLDSLSDIKNKIHKNFSFPLIIKPAKGTSCEGISIVRNEKNLKAAILKIRKQTSSEDFLVQELIEGMNVSVSLLSSGNKAMAISLNRQDLIIEEPDKMSEYKGGFVPFDTPFKNKSFRITEKIVELIKGLRGYVGIDLIFTNKEVFLMEINPRLTTSYIGLRRVININIAQAILDCCIEKKIPIKIKNSGYSYFSKIKFPIPISQSFGNNILIEEIITPPLLFPGDKASLALIAVKAKTKNKTYMKFEKIKKKLLMDITGGK